MAQRHLGSTQSRWFIPVTSVNNISGEVGIFNPKPHQQSGGREGSEVGFSITSWISNPGKFFFPWQNQGWVLETSLSVLPNEREWDGMSSRLAKGLEKGQNCNRGQEGIPSDQSCARDYSYLSPGVAPWAGVRYLEIGLGEIETG